MNRAVVLLLSLALAAPLAAQQLTFERAFLLRNVSGTAANPGHEPRHAWIFDNGGAWTSFVAANVFATYVSESGPRVQRNEAFSTNWVAAGVQRTLGSRGLLLLRGRVSLEPYTIAKDDGYPQMLQWVSPEAGGPLLDRMRPHDLVGEAAAHLAVRTGSASFVHLYAAAVGDPALGALPFELRSSALDFAEAPFAYDVQETTHDSTSVVTVGWASRFFGLEASVFHDAVTTGNHTDFDDGDIDSQSARLTITPNPSLSFQLSRGTLGDADLEVTSASVSYAARAVAATALYARRQTPTGTALRSATFELALRGLRNTVMGRVEAVDRPAGFVGQVDTKQTTHVTIGYIFDVIARPTSRIGVGANIDYHVNTHDLPARYGHKPQAIYAFVRARTE